MSRISFGLPKEAMQKAGWKIDQNEEACYIDVEQEEETVRNYESHSYSKWNFLPDLALERIYTYLTPRERYYCSLVCRGWYQALYLPLVWDNFLIDDQTLTRQKYNYYSGWQHALDHMRTQNCLNRIGRYLRGLEFRPQHSFNNIYAFMTMLSWSMDRSFEDKTLAGVGQRIRSLVYHFPCNMSQANDPDGIQLFGTGGQLLKALKDLLSKLKNLRVLKLIDFVLECYEAKHLLDEVWESCCLKMRVLNLVNVTTTHVPIMHVGLFPNLHTLIISPQNIDDDVILLLADTRLKHLHLLQNCYTPSHNALLACSCKAWRILKRDNPGLKVHLRVEALGDGEVVLQPEAPVYSITYKSPKANIKFDVLLQILDNYKSYLTVYGYEQLPRFFCPKSFHSRADSLMLLMCRQCCNLHTLVIREKISTSTVLLIAKTAKNLRRLIVRRFGCIIRCDWPKNPDWTAEFHLWLQRASRSYESVELEVSQILGNEWRFMTDQEFKKLEIDTKVE